MHSLLMPELLLGNFKDLKLLKGFNVTQAAVMLRLLGNNDTC